jgi:ABC-2 type transport system ATP-binding protein
VRENLTVFAGLYNVKHARERVRQLAEDLDLVAVLDRKTGGLSSGQKTRVGLAKALINQPELLLLDEPTASLDPDTADWVRTYLEGYRDRTGAAILLASHNMGEVERLCSDVLMMKAGRIVDRGAPDDLIARYGREDLEQVFLDIARNPQPAAAQ